MNWIEKLKQKIGIESESLHLEVSDEKRTTYDDSECSKLLEVLGQDLSIMDQMIVDQVRRYLVDQKDQGSKFTLIKQNGIVGLAYHPGNDGTLDQCRAYLYQLKERHLEIGYVKKLALRQVKGSTEVLSYYLKPSMRLQNSLPAEQLYGNVTLEIKVINNKIKHLKAVTTYYSDANYKLVRDWEEWYNVVFLGANFDL